MDSIQEIIEDRLAIGFGVKQYKEIVDLWSNTTDVSADEGEAFRTKFDAFYRIRRDEEWRKIYFELFQRGKKEALSFEQIIRSLYHQTGRIEASFSSKMLATLYPDKPIWDQYVLKNLNRLVGEDNNSPLVLTAAGEERLQNAIALYKTIEDKYNRFLATPKAKEYIDAFDKALPSYAEVIKDTKKIDCFLWGMR